LSNEAGRPHAGALRNIGNNEAEADVQAEA